MSFETRIIIVVLNCILKYYLSIIILSDNSLLTFNHHIMKYLLLQVFNNEYDYSNRVLLNKIASIY